MFLRRVAVLTVVLAALAGARGSTLAVNSCEQRVDLGAKTLKTLAVRN